MPLSNPAAPRLYVTVTRNGKIARLPRTVRQELNRRLDDGTQGKALIAWLNRLPEVQAVLAASFGGRPISEQNLSEWRHGGFLDWQRQQEAMTCVRLAAEDAQELQAEAGPAPLTDVLGASITLLLSRLIREIGDGQDLSPDQRQDLLLLIRQWCALRSGDHRAAKLKMQQQDWATARALAAAAQERREKAQEAEARRLAEQAPFRLIENAALESLARGLSEEDAKELRVAFESCRPSPPAPQAPRPSKDPAFKPNPTQSDPIKPAIRGKNQQPRPPMNPGRSS